MYRNQKDYRAIVHMSRTQKVLQTPNADKEEPKRPTDPKPGCIETRRTYGPITQTSRSQGDKRNGNVAISTHSCLLQGSARSCDGQWGTEPGELGSASKL